MREGEDRGRVARQLKAARYDARGRPWPRLTFLPKARESSPRGKQMLARRARSRKFPRRRAETFPVETFPATIPGPDSLSPFLSDP